MTVSLPTVGGDDGSWGTMLNNFLMTSLVNDGSGNGNGTLYTGATNSNNPGSVNWNLATATYPGIIQLTGDFGGTYSAPTISKIQGSPVSATTPTTGQVWQFVSGTWTPKSYGGDVSGTPSSSTVIGIQGVSVSNSTPSTGNVLEYNGSAWTPTAISSGTQRTFAFFAS